MKFPVILRSDHDEQMRLNNVIICTLQQREAELTAQLIQKEKEIQALISQLTANTVVEFNGKGHVKTIAEISDRLQGRGGWRGKAMKASRATIPPPKDSAQALEERVKKEGGV